MALCRSHELVEQRRIDRRVVIQNQDEVGSAIQRVADAEVVPSGVSEVPARLDDFDRKVRSCTPKRDPSVEPLSTTTIRRSA
jgi:hypothetical protein